MERSNQQYDQWIAENYDVTDSVRRLQSRNPLPYLFIRSRTIRTYDALGMVSFTGQQALARSRECKVNMQLLTLALLLYEKEHGSLPDGDWLSAIAPHLAGTPAAGVPAKCFSCPSNPSPEGMTTYALVQYGNANGDTVPGSLGTNSLETILLAELIEPVPLDKAAVTVDDALAWKGTGNPHGSGMHVGTRSGAVRFLNETADEEELSRWLGRARAGE